MTVQESKLLITIDSRNAERNTRAVANELENLTVKGDKADAQMTEMSSSIKTLVGFMGGLLTINKAIAMADGYTQMAARIRNATTSAEEYDLVQNRVLATANTTYRALSEAQEVYLSLSGGMRSLGKTTTQTLDLVDSLSFSFTHNATRTDQAQSAMDSLSKSMAKGKIDADAWISIVTGADNVIADMAKTTGKTEAEIRKLGAEGKASLEDLIQTLIATREQNEKLANNMENSLADGFTTLSNAVTVYLGKANESTSATGIMAGALGELAENLEAVANTGAVLGIGYVTSALLTKGAAVKASMVLSAQKQVADRAEMASQAQLSALEVQRTRQIAALAAQEVHLARLELNSALTRTERAAATMRLTQAEVALALAEKQKTAATLADTVAQNANNAARSRGAMLLGLVGGSIGAITIGAMALAASYAYMSQRTADANAKLEEQGRVAEKTKEELLALKGVQLDVAKDDLAASFEDQNDKLNKLNLSFNGFIRTVKNANAGNKEVYEISDQVHKGLMSQADAIERLNKLKLLTPEQKSQGLDLIKSYEEARVKAQQNADAQKTLGQQVTLSGNAASNAVGKVNDNTNAMYNNADAANAAADAQSKYISNLQKGAAQTIMTNKLIAKGWEIERAKMASQAAFENGGKVSAKDIQIIDMNIAANKKLQASEDAIANAKRGSSKASRAALSQQKKDAKEADRLAENQAKSRIDIDYRYLDEFKKFRADYLREVEEINKANFGSETSSMLKKAEEKYLFEEEMYLRQVTEEINAHKWSENQKLEYFYETQRIIVSESGKYNDEIKSLKLNALKEQEAHELGLIKLAKEQRIFQAEQAMMTEIQFMQERYRLEREEIIKTTATDLEERKRKLNALNTNTIRDGVGKNFSDPDDRGSQFLQSVDYAPISKSNSQRLDEEFEKEQAKMLANFEKVKQLNADNHEAILEAERIFLEAKQQLQDEYDFKAQDARRLDYENQLNMYGSLLSLTGGVFDELSGIVSQYKDENTKTYKTMFAFQKAAAFAQAIVSTELAAIQVMADPTALTLAQKQMHANIIRLTGYASAGIIAAQAFMGPGGDGYANGGFTGYGGKFDPAGIVHKGEVVWSQEDIKRWGGVNVVEAMRTSQPPAGYSDGGIVNPRDTYRVGMGTVEAINRNSDVQAERQAQASAKSQQSSSNGMQGLTIINQIEQDDLVGKYMQGPAGRQIVLNQIKANPSEFRRALGV